MWIEFISNFTGVLGIASLCLILVGIVFCIIEGIIPGFGFFGISGIVMEVLGVVVYAVQAIINNGSALPVLILIVLVLAVIMLLFLIIVRSAKFGILGKTPFVENKTAIPTDYGKNENETKKQLIGKRGNIIAECRPIGKIKISDKIYEVLAKESFLECGVEAEVVEVDGVKIIVDKVN